MISGYLNIYRLSFLCVNTATLGTQVLSSATGVLVFKYILGAQVPAPELSAKVAIGDNSATNTKVPSMYILIMYQGLH